MIIERLIRILKRNSVPVKVLLKSHARPNAERIRNLHQRAIDCHGIQQLRNDFIFRIFQRLFDPWHEIYEQAFGCHCRIVHFQQVEIAVLSGHQFRLHKLQAIINDKANLKLLLLRIERIHSRKDRVVLPHAQCDHFRLISAFVRGMRRTAAQQEDAQCKQYECGKQTGPFHLCFLP